MREGEEIIITVLIEQVICIHNAIKIDKIAHVHYKAWGMTKEFVVQQHFIIKL